MTATETPRADPVILFLGLGMVLSLTGIAFPLTAALAAAGTLSVAAGHSLVKAAKSAEKERAKVAQLLAELEDRIGDLRGPKMEPFETRVAMPPMRTAALDDISIGPASDGPEASDNPEGEGIAPIVFRSEGSFDAVAKAVERFRAGEIFDKPPGPLVTDKELAVEKARQALARRGSSRDEGSKKLPLTELRLKRVRDVIKVDLKGLKPVKLDQEPSGSSRTRFTIRTQKERGLGKPKRTGLIGKSNE